MSKHSTNDVSDRLAIPISTVKHWADKLGIGDKSSSGKWFFSDQDMHVLELVKSLRAEDCGFDTIQRQITPSDNERRQSKPSAADQPLAEQPPTINLDELTHQVTTAVVAAIKADNALARDYAVAARQVGNLEAQVTHLTQQLDETRRLLITGTSETETIKARLDQETQARIRAEAERDALKAQAARPWWRKLIGG